MDWPGGSLVQMGGFGDDHDRVGADGPPATAFEAATSCSTTGYVPYDHLMRPARLPRRLRHSVGPQGAHVLGWPGTHRRISDADAQAGADGCGDDR